MTIGLIGAGNMARALARGWDEPVLCADAGSGRAAALAAETGGEALDAVEVARRAEIVVLCHKPAGLEAVASALAPHARPVISALGGVSLAALRAAYPASGVVRVMPNTAAEVRAGFTCLCAEPDADPALLARARELFERVGQVAEVPERLMAVGTAIAGVAPAYAALLVEAQVDAAVRHGMPAALAGEIVTGSLGGSARLLAARGGDTLAVRREVASPGGLTARGLAALERHGLREAFAAATDAVVGSER